MSTKAIQPYFWDSENVGQDLPLDSAPSSVHRNQYRLKASSKFIQQSQVSEVRHAIKKSKRDNSNEWKRETGRIVELLAQHPWGLSKSSLLELFYPNYKNGSETLKLSFEVCLSKLLQRARRRFSQFKLEISYCKLTRRWRVESVG